MQAPKNLNSAPPPGFDFNFQGDVSETNKHRK